ncbi:hypothetical protein BH10CYA1_BH10CYA1_18110 [soil metagenome]
MKSRKGGRRLPGGRMVPLRTMAARRRLAMALKTAQMIETGAAISFDRKEKIPDVLRPYLPENSVLDAKRMAKIGKGYRRDLRALFALPTTVLAQPGDNAESIGERLLIERKSITGERITVETIAKEVARVRSLNQALDTVVDLPDRQVITYTTETLKALADATRFKHVPPLGQFLKASGKVSDAQIEAAFAHQQTLPKDAPRRFLGEILTDMGIISSADADAAEATQKGLKAYLSGLFAEFVERLK